MRGYDRLDMREKYLNIRRYWVMKRILRGFRFGLTQDTIFHSAYA
jgi:hypothetical protein